MYSGWFLQNLEKDFIPTLLHTTVRQAQQEKSGLWIFSTSNYASLCEKWQIYLKAGHKLCRNHVFVFIFRGEKIKFEAKLKLSVGDDNSADIEFSGEATEAAKTFANNGYLEALNGKIELCVDKECRIVELPKKLKDQKLVVT